MGLQGQISLPHWDGWEIEKHLELYCMSLGILCLNDFRREPVCMISRYTKFIIEYLRPTVKGSLLSPVSLLVTSVGNLTLDFEDCDKA